MDPCSFLLNGVSGEYGLDVVIQKKRLDWKDGRSTRLLHSIGFFFLAVFFLFL